MAKKIDSDRLTQREAAKLFGISDVALYSMHKRGKVSRAADKTYSVKEITAARAAQDPVKMEEGKAYNGGSAGNAPKSEKTDSLMQIKKHEGFFKAKRAELIYRREAKELIPRAEVEGVLSDIGAKLKAKMFNWEPRFVVHMTDTGKKLVNSEIRILIEEIITDLGGVIGEAE